MQDIEGLLEGGCLCGTIRYTLRGPVLFVSQCCCKDCQKATGTGHTTILGVHRDQLQFKHGTPKPYTSKGASGGDVVRHFCGDCGGRLYTSGTLPGAVVMVQAGSLDDPNRISPESVVYVKDSLAWDRFDDALPRFAELPDRRPAASSGGTGPGA
jgi:hypothetical protein